MAPLQCFSVSHTHTHIFMHSIKLLFIRIRKKSQSQLECNLYFYCQNYSIFGQHRTKEINGKRNIFGFLYNSQHFTVKSINLTLC